MRIWIDADGCPVVNQTLKIAEKNSIPVTVVKNYAVVIESDYAEVVTVDISKDAVDYFIANHMQKGDLVVTQDYGLAAMVLAKNGKCITQNGRVVHEGNIDFILESRHIGRTARLQNQRGPRHKKRTPEDDQIYEMALKTLLENLEG